MPYFSRCLVYSTITAIIKPNSCSAVLLPSATKVERVRAASAYSHYASWRLKLGLWSLQLTRNQKTAKSGLHCFNCVYYGGLLSCRNRFQECRHGQRRWWSSSGVVGFADHWAIQCNLPGLGCVVDSALLFPWDGGRNALAVCQEAGLPMWLKATKVGVSEIECMQPAVTVHHCKLEHVGACPGAMATMAMLYLQLGSILPE